MSRIKIFTTLFLTLIIGTVASIFLYQQWFLQYQDMVVKPDLSSDKGASTAAIELFALRKMQTSTGHVLGAGRLLGAFRESDTKKRHDTAFDALNALKSQAGLKEASFLVTVDGQGQAFANASKVNWTADWSKRKSISQALAGQASHEIGMFQKKAHIFVAIPISGTASVGSTPPPATRTDDGDTKDDKGDKDEKPEKRKAKRRKPPTRRASKKDKCTAGKYWYCFAKCAKRAKKKKGERYAKCLERSKTEKTCYCRKGKKTGALPTLRITSRLAQTAPDTRAKADDAKEPADTKVAKESPTKKQTIGVVVVGFALNDDIAKAIKTQTGLDLLFFDKGGAPLSGTITGKKHKELSAWLSAKNDISKAVLARDDKHIFPLNFEGGDSFYAMSAPIKSSSYVGLLMLKPMGPTHKLFWDFNLAVAVIAGISFFFALLLLLSGVTTFQREVESIEDKVLDTYNRGDLSVTFNEKAPWMLGSLAASLNLFFRQLRGDLNENDPQPRAAIDWSALEAQPGATSDDASYAASVRESVPEVPRAPLPTTQEASLTDEGEDDHQEAEPSTTDMINHFLENPDAHYLDVYTRYRDAKEECGEDVSRLKQDKFIEKLRKNAETYANKYDCRGVLFDVNIKDNKVILKPQLIPKE